MIQSSLNSTWIILFLGVSIALVWAYYFYKSNDEITPKIRLLLAFLRFSVLSILSFLALGLWLNYFNTQTHPKKIVIGIDHSASMQFGSDSNSIAKLIELLKSQRSDQIDVWQFGSEAKFLEDSMRFDGTSTNLQGFLQKIQGVYPEGQLDRVVIASDGMVNEGRNIASFDRLPFRVDAVGAGDTAVYPDAQALNLYHNAISYKGNETPFEVQFMLKDMKQAKYTYTLKVGDSIKVKESGIVEERELQIKNTHFIEIHELGQQPIVLNIQVDQKEKVIENNSTRSSIQVLKGQKKIALLYSFPSPDVAAFRRVLQRLESFDIKLFKHEDVKFDKLTEFDAVAIMHPQYLSNRFWQWEEKAKKGVLLFTDGTETPTIQNKYLSIVPTRAKLEVIPIFTPASGFLEIEERLLDDLPPVQFMRGNITFPQGEKQVLKAKTNGVNLNTPLLVLSNQSDFKLGVLNASNTWRWKVYDGLNGVEGNSFYEQLMSKVVEYVTQSKGNDRLKVDAPKVISTNQELILNASVLDVNYSIDGSAVVDIEIMQDANVLKKRFFKRDESYQVNMGALKPGNYTFDVTAVSGTDTLKKSGQIYVETRSIESMNKRADWESLKNWSSENGGEFYNIQSSYQYIQSLKNLSLPRIEYLQEEQKMIFELKWIFYLLVGLLSLEWSIRKYFGIR